MKKQFFSFCAFIFGFFGVNAQQDTSIMVDLFDLTLEELMNIEVTTATKSSVKLTEAPATIQVITQKDIVMRGYTNLEEILHDLGGFNFSKAHGINTSTIYQRGYRANNTDRTILMIDGVVENDMWKGVIWLDKQYTLANIKRIEVIYGPASALYGANAFQGVINVITKDGIDNKGLVNVYSGYGSYNTFINEIVIGKGIRDFDFNLTFRKYNSDEMDLSEYEDWDYEKPENAVFKFPIDKYENTKDDMAVHLKLKKGAFTFGGSWWNRRDGSGATYVDSYKKDDKYYSDITLTWNIRNMHLYTKYDTELFENFYSSTTMGFMRHEHTDDSNDMYIIDGDNQNVNFIYRHELSKRAWVEQQFNYNFNIRTIENQMTVGFEYKDAYIQGDYLKNSFLYVPGTDYPEITEVENHDMYDTRDFSVYLQNIVKPFRKLSITLGGRYDYNKIRHYAGFGGVFNPRIGLVYVPVNKLSVKLLYGTAYSRVPTWTLFSTTDTRMANPTLEPEIVKSKEISLGYKLNEYIFVEVAGYYNNYFDKVLLVKYPEGVLDPENPEITERNEAVGSLTIWGTESRVKFVWDRFTAFMNYTYSYPFDEDKKLEIGNIGQTMNFGLNYRFSPKINFNVRGNMIGERPSITRDENGDFLDIIEPAFVLNTNILFSDILINGLGFSINVNNILDTEYFDPGMRTGTGKYPSHLPQNGRNFFIKLLYNL